MDAGIVDDELVFVAGQPEVERNENRADPIRADAKSAARINGWLKLRNATRSPALTPPAGRTADNRSILFCNSP